MSTNSFRRDMSVNPIVPYVMRDVDDCVGVSSEKKISVSQADFAQASAPPMGIDFKLSEDTKKDSDIPAKAREIEKKVKKAEGSDRVYADLKIKYDKQKQENIDLETELTLEQRRRHTAEQETLRYRVAQVPPVAAPATVEGESVPVCQSFQNGCCAAGSFCKRNESLFQAGIGVTEAILAGVFAPHATVIVLATGAAIALFRWIVSFFD